MINKTHKFGNASNALVIKKKAEVEEVQSNQSLSLNPSELFLAPTNTLSKINETIDLFVNQMLLRAKEGSATNKDIKALGELVKANATLRQTQLAEDLQASKANSIASDEQISQLLVAAVMAGGPQARQALLEAAQAITASNESTEDNDNVDTNESRNPNKDIIS